MRKSQHWYLDSQHAEEKIYPVFGDLNCSMWTISNMSRCDCDFTYNANISWSLVTRSLGSLISEKGVLLKKCIQIPPIELKMSLFLLWVNGSQENHLVTVERRHFWPSVCMGKKQLGQCHWIWSFFFLKASLIDHLCCHCDWLIPN